MNNELTVAAPGMSVIWRWLPLILATVLGVAFAVAMPFLSGPDERGHIAYVSALSSGHLPIFPATETADIERGITWQAQHPPLFYALATPFYKIVTLFAPQSGLLVVRLLGVLCFVFTVWVAQKIATFFMAEKAAWLAALLVATHPVISYVMSMANNESLAILLSSVCVWTALLANPPKLNNPPKGEMAAKWKASHHLALCALCCGLALWTKLTTIAGIVAAVYLVGLSRESENSGWKSFQWRRALGVLGGAILLWLPWALLMKVREGSFFPTITFVPGLPDGPLAILLFPQDALIAAISTYAEFAVGLLSPFWLLRGFVPSYFAHIGGALVLLWMIWVAKKSPASRYAIVSFAFLYFLVLNTVFFRFYVTALFAARYTGAATVLFCVVAAQQAAGWKRAHRVLAGGAWGALALCNFAFVWWFFLVRT